MSINLGRTKARQSSAFERSPFITDTGNSSISGRSIRFDPSIRRIQDEALGNYASIFGDVGSAADRFLTQSSDLRGRFAGNQGAFMEARVRPVNERFSNLRTQTQQDLGRRGLAGSSLQIDALRNIDKEAATAEGDARALATQELAGFEAGLNAQELQALNTAAQQRAAITGETLEIAKARLLQELGAFGLGQTGKESINAKGSSLGIEGSGSDFKKFFGF